MAELTPVHAAVLAVLVLLLMSLAALNLMINGGDASNTGMLSSDAAEDSNGETPTEELPVDALPGETPPQ